MSERHTSLCDEMRDHQYGCICGAWDGKEPSNVEFAQHLAAANHSESPNSCRDCATLTHRASLWRERCNNAEARVAAYQREIHRIACGEQVEGDGLCPDGIALAAAQDAYEAAGYEAFQCANERDAARFLAAGWRRLARHYQSCHLAGHACLRETHRKRAEAATARDAAIANADAVLSTAEAMRVERDRMRDYWRSEAEMRGACLVEIDQLRTKLARAEGVVGHMRDIAEHECAYRDGCPTFGSRHGQCTGCKAREALATYEEG